MWFHLNQQLPIAFEKTQRIKKVLWTYLKTKLKKLMVIFLSFSKKAVPLQPLNLLRQVFSVLKNPEIHKENLKNAMLCNIMNSW